MPNVANLQKNDDFLEASGGEGFLLSSIKNRYPDRAREIP
jgi:hypothetical protein